MVQLAICSFTLSTWNTSTRDLSSAVAASLRLRALPRRQSATMDSASWRQSSSCSADSSATSDRKDRTDTLPSTLVFASETNPTR